MSTFWADKRVMVTGGAGFLGTAVCARLRALGCTDPIVPRAMQHDLRDSATVAILLRETRPEILIHLAATSGGIGGNQAQPGTYFYDNLIMGAQLMEHARQLGVAKFVAVGTACAYPKHTPIPFSEDQLWEGYPDPSNAAFGLAKKMLIVQAQAYRQQWGFNAINLIPTNLYGPGDNFAPNTSHVIPALIRKCLDAQESNAKEIVCWGDGTPTRDFLYVDDAAAGLLLAAEHYDAPDPINIASHEEISIRDLATNIAAHVGFLGDLSWDTTKPGGQPRRCLDASKAEALFGFRSTTNFDDGLRRTIAWYRQTSA